MIDLYTSFTTNAQRASIALLESGLHYTLHPVDLYKGEHKTPAFLAINPNGTLPLTSRRNRSVRGLSRVAQAEPTR